MTVMQQKPVDKSRFNDSDKYRHEVFLSDTEAGFEVKVIRYNNWGVGKTELVKHAKTSLKEAEELYDFYLGKLEASV